MNIAKIKSMKSLSEYVKALGKKSVYELTKTELKEWIIDARKTDASTRSGFREILNPVMPKAMNETEALGMLLKALSEGREFICCIIEGESFDGDLYPPEDTHYGFRIE